MLKIELGPMPKSDADAITRYFVLLRSSKSYLRALAVEGSRRVTIDGLESDLVGSTDRLIAVLSLLEISKLLPVAVTREELLEDLIRPVMLEEEAHEDELGGDG